MKGEVIVETIPCDQAANTCQVKVPAPGFALVFMTDEAGNAASDHDAQTFATSAITKYKNTATIDEAVLATSNGNKGMENMVGSTSFGSSSGTNGASQVVLPSIVALVAMAGSAGFVIHAFAVTRGVDVYS